MNKAKNIDEYINGFPPEIQKLLTAMRKTIQKAAPAAEEKISYGMPTFTLNGNLVHFAAFKEHIGFYPTPNGIDSFKKELSKFKSSKGAVQFPFGQPLPLELVTKIVKFRIEEQTQMAKPAADDFLKALSVPAQRALAANGVKTLKQLAKHTEDEVLSWHGVGPSAIPKLQNALKAEGLSFKK